MRPDLHMCGKFRQNYSYPDKNGAVRTFKVSGSGRHFFENAIQKGDFGNAPGVKFKRAPLM